LSVSQKVQLVAQHSQ